jgi:hypothetical protein
MVMDLAQGFKHLFEAYGHVEGSGLAPKLGTFFEL